ncbi:hypothetical protein Tco_0561911, partial [Tanacetum coccineum]
MTHPHPKRSFVPQAVLTRLVKLSTAGIAVNTVRPVNTANTIAVNTVRPVNTANTKVVNIVRPVNTANTKAVNTAASKPVNNIINTNVNTSRLKYTTARDRAVVSENKGKGANVVKASACWVWKSKNSSASTTFKKYSYIDARGGSKYGRKEHFILPRGRISTAGYEVSTASFILILLALSLKVSAAAY